MQFAMDLTPLRAIIFDTDWGRDAGRPTTRAARWTCTSPGHNVEFCWLLLHAADVLGMPRQTYAGVVRAHGATTACSSASTTSTAACSPMCPWTGPTARRPRSSSGSRPRR